MDNHRDKNEEEIVESQQIGSLLESRSRQISDALNERLDDAFHKETSQVNMHEIAKIAIEYDPIDLSRAVTRLPSSSRHIVYDNLPDIESKAIFLLEVSTQTRLAIFRYLSNREICDVIEEMAADDAVEVLEDLPEKRQRRVIELLEPQKGMKILELLKHGLDTAGRLMTNEFFAFSLNNTIEEAAHFIRENPGIELMRSIFVLDEDAELIGYVPARNLVINPKHFPLKQVMRPVLHTVRPEASSDEVVELVERYNIPMLPVVDDEQKLLGVITFEDVVDIMEDIQATTIASIGGTLEDVSEYDPLVKRFFSRAPWLIVTLFAGLVTATGLAYFHQAPWFAVVPFFVPLITGMSGNVGIQCSTIFVRGIATGEISKGSKRELILREFSMGAVIGLFFGLLCGVVVYMLNTTGVHHIGEDPLVVGVTVCSGVFGACMTATVLGTMSPLYFERMNIDPAVASGPIVTAFNDVLATFMYFLVAKIVYALFVL